MKGKRYTTEDKIRILREAARGGKSIQDLCREETVSEVTFPRWKKPFGHMDINEARRLKELEKEHNELKKMLAESRLKNRGLEAVCKKNGEPGPSPGGGAGTGEARGLFAPGGLPHSAAGAFDIPLSWASPDAEGRSVKQAALETVRGASALRGSKDRGLAAPCRLARRQATPPTPAPGCRTARPADEAASDSARGFHGAAPPGDPAASRVDLGLHRRARQCVGEP